MLRLLQINVALMAFLGSLMLGLGERSIWLPMLALCVAVSSVILTDIKRWFVLNTPAANVAGMIAVVVSMWDFLNLTRDAKLLALADLLVYLQCVLLYRQKNQRVYWMLALLSLLQVAVAAVLNLTVVFPIVLMIYMFVGLTTLAMFLMVVEQSTHWRIPTAEGEQPLERTPGWIFGRPEFSTGPSPHRDVNRCPGLFFQVLLLIFATLLLTPGIFMLVPRARGDGANWSPSAMVGQNLVGFTDQVSLGELGQISENEEDVLRVRFKDFRTGQPFQLIGEPLLRGSILTHYENRTWTKSSAYRVLPMPHLNKDFFLAENPGEIFMQEFTIRPMAHTQTLFSVFPFENLDPDTSIFYDPGTYEISRPQGLCNAALKYELVTTGIRDGRQLRRTEHNQSWLRRRTLLTLPVADLSEQDPLAGLKVAAVDVLANLPPIEHPGDEAHLPFQDWPEWEAKAEAAAARRIERALALERYLSSERFQYTLTPPVRQANVDPIEDFITTNPQGHCEYFASALTLMLRSQGIPARLVVGFKGGEWNEYGSFYQVRQKHAHTWVEAYIEPTKFGKRGSWYTLDPTPVVQTEEDWPVWSYTLQMFDYVESLWSGYVLGMNTNMQKEMIYDPLSDAATGLVAEPDWSSVVRNVRYTLSGRKSIRDWISWSNIAGLVAFLACIAGGIWFWRRRARFRRARQNDDASQDPEAAQVAFYRRLEQLLSEIQLQRGNSQTPREFATQAAATFSKHSETQTVVSLPQHLVDLFYRVRFGRHPLDNRDMDEVEQALEQIEAGVGALAAEKPQSQPPQQQQASSPESNGSLPPHGRNGDGHASRNGH